MWLTLFKPKTAMLLLAAMGVALGAYLVWSIGQEDVPGVLLGIIALVPVGMAVIWWTGVRNGNRWPKGTF
ncbi:MAG TPA: hypothetical protein VK507_12625 [Iamia sp.]|nr:hypothetical protein [Iamia sp.]